MLMIKFMNQHRLNCIGVARFSEKYSNIYIYIIYNIILTMQVCTWFSLAERSKEKSQVLYANPHQIMIAL